MENISEHVKREREARGVTIEELAKETLISVAVLKDIESGNFDKYKGDELYLKMYLRKIAKYLGLEEKELDAEFESLTQEIQLKEIKQEDFNRRLAQENKKNITISGKVSDTFKDLKKVKPKKNISNKRVYEDRYLLRYFKYALVGLVCLAIIVVVWYAIVVGRSSSEPSNFKDDNIPTVEGNTNAGKQDTDDSEDNKKEDEKKVETPVVEVTKNGTLDYNVKIDPSLDTFKLKMEFVGYTWARLDVNGSEYSGFKSGIYNRANKANSATAEPEVVELDIPTADFQYLELKLGNFTAHRFYINDQPLVIEANEYSGGKRTLKVTRVQ